MTVLSLKMQNPALAPQRTGD